MGVRDEKISQSEIDAADQLICDELAAAGINFTPTRLRQMKAAESNLIMEIYAQLIAKRRREATDRALVLPNGTRRIIY